MKEEEALKKWCPFSMAQIYNDRPAVNRSPDERIIDQVLCIGSRCMAWETSILNDINKSDGDCRLMKK